MFALIKDIDRRQVTVAYFPDSLILLPQIIYSHDLIMITSHLAIPSLSPSFFSSSLLPSLSPVLAPLFLFLCPILFFTMVTRLLYPVAAKSLINAYGTQELAQFTTELPQMTCGHWDIWWQAIIPKKSFLPKDYSVAKVVTLVTCDHTCHMQSH